MRPCARPFTSTICCFCQLKVGRFASKTHVRNASNSIRKHGAAAQTTRLAFPGPYGASERKSKRYGIRDINDNGVPNTFIASLREKVAALKRGGGPAFDRSIGINWKNPRHAQIVRDWFRRVGAAIKNWEQPGHRVAEQQLRERLLKAWTEGRQYELAAELRFSLIGQIVNDGVGDAEVMRQARVANANYPAEWYPTTRHTPRKIHLHIGPTNSGKTYHALQRLLNSESGIYAGPLRLLAYEVYNRIISRGRNCHLITGDERIVSENDDKALASCTVEMVPIGTELDVAVIDEIQMLGSDDRGWAWTNAVLGLRAKELHLCGEARSLPLVKALAASTGEELIVHEYQRLSPLEVGESGLGGDLKNVQPGDCLVAFSRARIHQLVHELSPILPGKVAVIYGSLPPDVRVEQARLFNDPDSGYDVVVASDAIGMGLNLNIRRIIFTDIDKFNGIEEKRLEIASLKQIGGRAGRYRIAPSTPAANARLDVQNPDKNISTADQLQTAGIVTTLDDDHLRYVDSCMNREPPPLRTAGLKLRDEYVLQFAAYFPPSTPLSYILSRLHEVTRTSRLHHMCDKGEDVLIADAIGSVPDIRIEDRLTFCAAPADVNNDAERAVLIELAKCAGTMSGGALLNLKTMPLDVLEKEPVASLRYLRELESLHKCLTIYIWLAFRFRAIFVSEALASHTRRMTEQKISETLAALAEVRKETKKKPSFKQMILEEEQVSAEPADEHIEDEQPDNAPGEATERTLDSLLGDLLQENKREDAQAHDSLDNSEEELQNERENEAQRSR